MPRLVAYETFRTLKACRQIEKTNAEILTGLTDMRRSALQARCFLEQAGRGLDETLEHLDLARTRLCAASAQHKRVMKVVDHIMDNSPAFRDLR